MIASGRAGDALYSLAHDVSGMSLLHGGPSCGAPVCSSPRNPSAHYPTHDPAHFCEPVGCVGDVARAMLDSIALSTTQLLVGSFAQPPRWLTAPFRVTGVFAAPLTVPGGCSSPTSQLAALLAYHRSHGLAHRVALDDVAACRSAAALRLPGDDTPPCIAFKMFPASTCLWCFQAAVVRNKWALERGGAFGVVHGAAAVVVGLCCALPGVASVQPCWECHGAVNWLWCNVGVSRRCMCRLRQSSLPRITRPFHAA